MASQQPQDHPSSACALQVVPLGDIDAQDRSLALSRPWQLEESLLTSIRRHGILAPLRLRTRPESRLQLVHGFRRFEAARQLNLPSVPALVCSDPNPLRLFRQAIEENRTSRGLGDLEKAAALWTLKYRFDVPEIRLVEEFLPLLDLKPDRRHLQMHLELAELPDSLQRALGQGLEAETALRLCRHPSDFQQLCCRIIRDHRLGKNRQKELVELLDEITAASGDSAAEVWGQTGAAEAERQADLSTADRWKRALALLRQRRYPALWRHQARFEELKSTLRLPPQIRLQPPPHFEGSSLEIAMTIRRPDQLAGLSEELKRISDSSEWAEMFELL